MRQMLAGLTVAAVAHTWDSDPSSGPDYSWPECEVVTLSW